MDPPFTKLDLVTCRNLLIYLDAGAAAEAHSALPLQPESRRRPDARELGDRRRGVGSLCARCPARRACTAGSTMGVRAPSDRSFSATFAPAGRCDAGTAQRGRSGAANLQSLADRLILQRYSPAVVLTAAKGDILYISGRTGKYLEPAAGQANWNIFAMARPGLGYALSEAFGKAVRGGASVTVHGGDGGNQRRDAGGGRHRPAAHRARRAAGNGAGPLHGRGRPREETAPGKSERTAIQRRTNEGRDAGAPAGPRGASVDARGDADLARGAEERQRGAPVDERGAPVARTRS